MLCDPCSGMADLPVHNHAFFLVLFRVKRKKDVRGDRIKETVVMGSWHT